MLKFILISILFTCPILRSNADGLFAPSSDTDHPNWESHAGAIGIYFHLTSHLENQTRKVLLDVLIKNISSRPLSFNSNLADYGIRVIYLDNQSSEIPLHKFDANSDNFLHTLPAVMLEPGQVLRVALDIDARDLALLRSKPVKIVFSMSDSSSNKPTVFESAFKMLSLPNM